MPVVRYPEVLADLRTKILDGTYPVGEPLPHTEALKETYDVSAHVITRAMRELKDQQLIWRVANRGMVVLGPPVVVDLALHVAPSNNYDPWAEACRRVGSVGRMVMKGFRPESATADVAEALGLRTEDPVFVRSWQATLDGQVVRLDTSYYPFNLIDNKLVSGTASSIGGIYAALTEAGMAPIAITRQLISARPARDDEAAQLKLARGAWVITVERITRDETGRVVELLRLVVNPLRVRLLEEDLPLTPPA